VRLNLVLVLASLFPLLVGCAANKAFLDLPLEQRQHVRFVSSVNRRPDIRFASEGARTAREFGGLIALAVSGQIEHSTNRFGQSLSVIGCFEAGLIEDLFLTRLHADAVDFKNLDLPSLEVRVRTVGLREVERARFAPFAEAFAQLSAPDGKQLWAARVQSTGQRHRALDQYRDDAKFYRQDFNEVAEDIVNQLIEGPIRAVTR
jgi:hypothetical protein